MTDSISELDELNERTREIFRSIVESYLATGEPVGSRNLSRALPMALSPASIRNVMSDLEHLGLIYAPHISAGRLPTQTGLRLFVDAILEVGELTEGERSQIEAQIHSAEKRSIESILSEAGEMISGLSHCAGLVLVNTEINRLKHIEFVPLEPGKALVVLVGENQDVENRIIELPAGLPPSALTEATNYMNAHLRGLTLQEAHEQISKELSNTRAELDQLTSKVIQAGLAEWSGGQGDSKSLIVKGQSNLLKDLTAAEDIDRIRQLFDDLEAKGGLINLLESTDTADGVRIFIGSENKLFSLSGSSVVVAPFHDRSSKVVGALGVIGPTRLNYGRIIPMIDYTARLVGRILT